jgi:RNA polymerase sigma-70 factor (ECF subfamily)
VSADFVSRTAEEVLDSLAQRAARGDKAAFGTIFEQTSGELYRFARGLSGNDSVAEDIVAATYLRAWQSAKSYRVGSNNYHRWLLGIARNQIYDDFRTKHQTVPISEMDFAAPEVSDREITASEVRHELDRLLATITPDQREVVVLRYIDNKSHEEIGKLLGKRAGAVRAQLLRALRHMRTVVRDAAP